MSDFLQVCGRLLGLSALAALMVAAPVLARPPIDVVASNWKFTPATITVNAGEATTLRLTSTAGVHGITSEEVGIRDTTIKPGSFAEVSFTPKSPGTYAVHCSIVCGAGHPNMVFTIVVKGAAAMATTAPDTSIPAPTRTALSHSTAWSPTMVGVGAHGYGFSIGTWSCTNSMPSPVGGPATFSWIFGRTSVDGALSFHETGKNFDAVGYLVYDTKTKTWWNPITYTNSDYSAEFTRDTGRKVIFSGLYFTAASKFARSQIRDTLTFISSTKVTDLGESQTGGTWKAQWKNTCTKS